jgi:universal stress protein E
VIADCAAGNVTALQKARELAGPFNANLSVVRFINANPASDVASQVAAAEADLLQDLEAVFGSQAPEHEVVVTTDLAAWVKGYCVKSSTDLVIKTGHRSESAFYTPTDWHLIRQLPCAVLIASDVKWRAKPVIMATVDLNDESAQQQSLNQAVLHRAREFAEARKAEPVVTYSIPVPKALVELDIIEKDDFSKKKLPEAEKRMTACLQAGGMPGAATHILNGPPDKTLPSLANSLKADLVVVGSVGRTGLSGLLLGNTAEKVLHNLRTDILVVKPDQ